MRCLLKVFIPVETGNAAMIDGTLNRTIDSILSEVRPEAAYFAEEDGKRTGYIFLDVKEPSQIPAIAEPWFLAFNARITVRPAMIAADLAEASPSIASAAQSYSAAG